MATIDQSLQDQEDIDEICRLSAEGKRVTDPELLRRIQQRVERAKAMANRGFSFGNKAIRDMRGPLDEEQERELTLDQMHLLRKGDARLVDPETGEEYVLVPVADYKRLRGL